MNKYLFDEFTPVSPKAWKQKIQVDLKGEDYNQTLLWKTEENIVVKPFYTKEDRVLQKINGPQKNFNVCQTIFIDDERIANKLAVSAIKEGVSAIEFIADSKFKIEETLKNITLQNINIYFKLNFLDSDFVILISKYVNAKNVFFNIDIIGNLAKTGNWFFNLKEDVACLGAIVKETNNSICINSTVYQNAGANITQQLAYALAHANEYLNYYGEQVASKIHFNFSIGSNYFFEIAKIRAFRVLWDSLLTIYGLEKHPVHIFSEPTTRNKTLYSNHINILRTTSECMSAILGGSDTVSNKAYDEIFHKSNEHSERIARNQLLVLQQECGINNVAHITNGVYYIESITNQLAENALEVFKLIEKSGGFLKQLKEGVIQKKITESATKEQSLIDNRELVVVGANKHQDKSQFIKNEIELFPFVKKRHIKTLIQPIIQKRLTENIEQERLNNE